MKEKRYKLKEFLEILGISSPWFYVLKKKHNFKPKLTEDTDSRDKYYFTDEDIEFFKNLTPRTNQFNKK